MTYLDSNATYWERGYDAENVDAPAFRFYGRFLKGTLGMTGERHERFLDFGAGQGAAVEFFQRKGFDAYGVDISETDVGRGVARHPQLADRIQIIDPKPAVDDVWFGGDFDIVLSIQVLYYLSNTDLATRLESLHAQMKPGGIFYASMMGTECYFYGKSEPADDGLRSVAFSNSRYSLENYFVNFVDTEDDLEAKFPMFEPMHIGWYTEKLLTEEGASHHWTYIGRKR